MTRKADVVLYQSFVGDGAEKHRLLHDGDLLVYIGNENDIQSLFPGHPIVDFRDEYKSVQDTFDKHDTYSLSV